MVTVASPQPQSNDNDQRRRKQTLERAKANHLSRQLQMRLQYARLKVEHGWQRQNLNEVENLYFHHSAVGRSGNITNTNNPKLSISKVGHLAAPPVILFSPTAGGGGGFGSGRAIGIAGTGMHAGTTITTGEGFGMATSADTGMGEVTHDKDLVDNVLTSGGDGGGSDVGRRESIGTGMGIGMAHDNGMLMDVGGGIGRVDENSQLDPKILMESAVGGARGCGAVERGTLDRPQQAPDSPQVGLLPQVQIASSDSPPTSTSLWPAGVHPPLHPVQYQSILATTVTTTSAATTDSKLSTATYVPQHPDFSSHPYSQPISTSLTYQQQIRSQGQDQLQQQSQAPVRVSTLPQLEVPIPLSNTSPSIADSITAAFPPINQNPQRSRSGSTSPWPRGNNSPNTASTNANVNPGENASSSSSAGGGGSGVKQNGFGSSALTYDSFWSGFKGSTTPNTTISLPASTQALTTSASALDIAGGSTRPRINFNSDRGLTPIGNTNAFDMEMGVGMGINMGIGMDDMMNIGVMGMGMALTDDTAGDGVGFGR